MKILIAAFLLALLAIVSVFFALSLVGVDHTVAASIATTIIGGIPYIRESLEKQLAARAQPQGIQVLSLGRFSLPPQRLILYGSLLVIAAMQFASGFGGLIVVMLDVEREKLPLAVMGPTLLVVYPTAFLVGRWVGRRSVGKGLLTIFLIALLARVAVTLGDFVLLREDLALFLTSSLGEGSVLSKVAKQVVSGVVLLFVLGALGYWRGTRQRLGSYLGYLLKNVPDSTRHAIVELAFEEAGRATGPAMERKSM